ncbi:pep-cterm sorting domain-containing protein [Anaeramoeba ignava]|uniref:Pep-cterm sorting domain-containing protein n=1 Tax=Anaeramoeba ignava TaxID=1746090 RepID=A0A9Q0LAX9_ANAIG|nr:pep-cterm sorting domain-containing protein [Anaeramoeba ignava]
MEAYSNLEKLSNDLKQLFQNQNEENYSNFEIICEQNQISFKTHKSILSSRSQYFKSLFNSKMKEFQENKLILSDVSSSILSLVLNYFYSGKIEINSENVIEILMFSSKYLIDELIEICSKFIKNNLQTETVIDVLKLSESMNFNQLLDFSYQFISENFDEFIKTSFFFELEENHLNSILSNDEIIVNEFEIFQSIINWGKHKSSIKSKIKKKNKQEKEKLQNQISSVIDKIRFIDFSKQEVKKVLKEDLIPKQISQKLTELKKLQKSSKNEAKLKEFIEKENSLIFKSRIGFKSAIIKEKKYMNALREWLNDDKFFLKMKLGFSAKRDAFDSKKWHEKVDDRGKTLIVIKTTNNCIFGGYSKVGWLSGKNLTYIADPDSFLFSLKNLTQNLPQKFPIQDKKKSNALYYDSSDGPVFDDMRIYSTFKTGRSIFFGVSFTLPNGMKDSTKEAMNYFAGGDGYWNIEDIETFFI